MNILQVTPRLPAPPNDGGAVYIFYTSKYLSQLGHHLQIASLISNKHDQDEQKLSEFATVHAVDGKFKPYNLKSVILSTFSRKPISIQHRMDKHLMKRALSKVSVMPDVILLEGIHTAAFLNQIRKSFSNVPVVLRQSNVEYLLLKRNAASTKNPLLKAFYYDQSKLMKNFEIDAMKQVDAVTAITEFDKKNYLQHLPNLKCFVSPAGADLPKSLNLNRKPNRLLALSNWRWKPNIDGLKWFLENVWPQLIEEYPNIHFDVIGGGLKRDFIKKHKHPNIHFLGFVQDIEPYRQSSTLFVAPLFSGSGMKLKIVEGMASGLPIVTTDIGVEGIKIENGIHYLLANTANEFFEAITYLLEHKEKREQLSREAKSVAKEKYGWETITKRLANFLDEEVVSKET